ncbi:hypothetical protein M8C21_026813, partial [Ambrosia artemisiifolia]
MAEEIVQVPAIDDNPQTNIEDGSSSNPSPPRQPLWHLIEGSSKVYHEICVPLYHASRTCNWKVANAIFDQNKDMKLLTSSITRHGDTSLHIAAKTEGNKHVDKFVREMVKRMTKVDLELQNSNGNTALYLAAAAGNTRAVQIMVEKNRALLTIAGSNGSMMPLYVAALYGKKDTVKYLYDNSNNLCDDGWTPQNRGWLLLRCVENDIFDTAIEIVKAYPETGTGSVLAALARKPEAFREKKFNIIAKTINWGKRLCSENLSREAEANPNIIGRTITSVSTFMGLKEENALQLLRIIWNNIKEKQTHEIEDILRGPADVKEEDKVASGIVGQTNRLQTLISECILNMNVDIQDTIRSGNEDQSIKLQKVVSDHIVNMNVKTQNLIKEPLGTSNIELSGDRKETFSSRILFIAAEHGNAKFLAELIWGYPHLLRKKNDDGQTIFHIAVKHRHEAIYNMLHEYGLEKQIIAYDKDDNGNNMLHIVGKCPKQKRLEDVSGVALKMQRELLWFKEVEAAIPYYKDKKNKDGLTPYELFTEEHKDMMAQGERWMITTANQCLVVAALIIVMVFAAAITFPGGYKQTSGKDNGSPVFLSKASFWFDRYTPLGTYLIPVNIFFTTKAPSARQLLLQEFFVFSMKFLNIETIKTFSKSSVSLLLGFCDLFYLVSN